MRNSAPRAVPRLGLGLLSFCVAMFLFGCGGGGESSDAGSAVTTAQSSGLTISGTPAAEALIDVAFSFEPSVAGAASETLTFAIQNLPEWASFDTATGALSGTPSAADVGEYADIVISVSDGATTASLAAFAVVVTEVGSGSVTLSWTPPTSNTDGTVLSNLAGYEIHYGTDADALTKVVSISNASISTYLVDNLTSATWYFAIKAYTVDGAESDFSAVASKTI